MSATLSYSALAAVVARALVEAAEAFTLLETQCLCLEQSPRTARVPQQLMSGLAPAVEYACRHKIWLFLVQLTPEVHDRLGTVELKRVEIGRTSCRERVGKSV